MSIFSSYKKIFLFGFILVVLVAIPLFVYMAQQRQKTTTKAAASTILSFDPQSQTVQKDGLLSLNVVLDPGTGSLANQVSFVKLSINFDSSKFATITDSLTPNPNSPNTLTFILEDASYVSGSASISLSIGADPTKVVTTKTKIAILKLKALAVTEAGNPSSITFGSDTQVLSIASSDQTSENVLSTTTPARITIAQAAQGSISPTPTSSFAPSTSTPTPTPAVGGTGVSTESGVFTPVFEIEPTPTPTIFVQEPLPPTGPGEIILGIGILGAILTIIGGAVLILL